jgi:hypothetical protein
MPQLNGPAVNRDTDAQRATVVAPFPIRLVLMTIGAQALKVVWMALEIAITFRASDMVDLSCGPDDAAQFAMLAKRPGPQGPRAGDLAPVSRAGSHVDLPVARVVRAIGAG